MRYLVLTSDAPDVDAGRMSALLREEAAAAWKLRQADILREIWFTPERDAVLMLETPSEAEARAALDTLPLIREGLLVYRIHALQPYDGFARLFG